MKQNKGIVVLVVILVIAVLSLGGFIVYDKVLKTNNDNKDVEKNETKQEISTNPTDYLEIVDEDFAEEDVEVQTVKFKNISAPNFLSKQNKLIDSIRSDIDNYDPNASGGESYKAKSNIWYQINANILTVYYELNEEEALGSCKTIITTNIDLEQNKELTNEEVLAMGNYTFEDFALEEYNKTLYSYEEGKKVYNSNYEEISKGEFTNNKEEYLNAIEEELENLLNAYIQDNEIKYSYIQEHVDILYKAVGKGGCFPYITKELGSLK